MSQSETPQSQPPHTSPMTIPTSPTMDRGNSSKPKKPATKLKYLPGQTRITDTMIDSHKTPNSGKRNRTKSDDFEKTQDETSPAAKIAITTIRGISDMADTNDKHADILALKIEIDRLHAIIQQKYEEHHPETSENSTQINIDSNLMTSNWQWNPQSLALSENSTQTDDSIDKTDSSSQTDNVETLPEQTIQSETSSQDTENTLADTASHHLGQHYDKKPIAIVTTSLAKHVVSNISEHLAKLTDLYCFPGQRLNAITTATKDKVVNKHSVIIVGAGNDCEHNPLPKVKADYEALIAQLKLQNPKARIICCIIPPRQHLGPRPNFRLLQKLDEFNKHLIIRSNQPDTVFVSNPFPSHPTHYSPFDKTSTHFSREGQYQLARNFEILIQKCLITPIAPTPPRPQPMDKPMAAPAPKQAPYSATARSGIDTSIPSGSIPSNPKNFGAQTGPLSGIKNFNANDILRDFDVTNSKSNGHCLLYTFLDSYQNQVGGHSYEIHDIGQDIFEHAENCFNMYQHLYPKGKEIFLREISKYLFEREYRSDAVDLVPCMIANVYNVNVVIVDAWARAVRSIPPTICPSQTDVFIRKTGTHYDGLTPKPRLRPGFRRPF